MLTDLLLMRAWRGDPLDLDRHARFSCALGRLRRRVAAMFLRPAI